jgi:hypothetical protein
VRRQIGLWLAALALTLAAVVWQRLSGPTHPIRFAADVGSFAVSGKLLRSHTTGSDLPVRVDCTYAPEATPGAPDELGGMLVWRRFPTDEPWRRRPLEPRSGVLVASLPPQPPAGKLEYWLELTTRSDTLRVPPAKAAVARFTGHVPGWVLVAHIVTIFAALLVAMRAGLEALVRGPRLRGQARTALALLAAGGLILGPVVQKFAFGAFWTGWPLGEDLTDNKLAFAVLLWALAVWRLRSYRPETARGRGWVLAAVAVVLLVYAIPHSLHGSTLDYATGEQVQY